MRLMNKHNEDRRDNLFKLVVMIGVIILLEFSGEFLSVKMDSEFMKQFMKQFSLNAISAQIIVIVVLLTSIVVCIWVISISLKLLAGLPLYHRKDKELPKLFTNLSKSNQNKPKRLTPTQRKQLSRLKHKYKRNGHTIRVRK